MEGAGEASAADYAAAHRSWKERKEARKNKTKTSKMPTYGELLRKESRPAIPLAAVIPVQAPTEEHRHSICSNDDARFSFSAGAARASRNSVLRMETIAASPCGSRRPSYGDDGQEDDDLSQCV